jgi:hypothetical protein
MITMIGKLSSMVAYHVIALGIADNWAVFQYSKSIPTDLWDTGSRRVELGDHPRDETQSLHPWTLLRPLEQQLHPQAYAEEWPVGPHVLPECLYPALVPKRLHGLSEVALSGENDHLRTEDVVGCDDVFDGEVQ